MQVIKKIKLDMCIKTADEISTTVFNYYSRVNCFCCITSYFYGARLVRLVFLYTMPVRHQVLCIGKETVAHLANVNSNCSGCTSIAVSVWYDSGLVMRLGDAKWWTEIDELLRTRLARSLWKAHHDFVFCLSSSRCHRVRPVTRKWGSVIL